MLKFRYFLWIVPFLSFTVFAQSIDELLKEAQIKESDSQASRVAKLLHTINDNRYIRRKDPMSPSPFLSDSTRQQGIQTLQKYGYNAQNPMESGPWQYQLDSQRTPEEIAQQCVGGMCGSVALLTAKALIQSGVPSSKVRVVSAVTSIELERMCKGRKGQPYNQNHGGFGNGHVFVMIQDAETNEWKIVNTTQSFEGELERVHAPELLDDSSHFSLQPRRGKHWKELEQGYKEHLQAQREASSNRPRTNEANTSTPPKAIPPPISYGLIQRLNWSDVESEAIESPDSLSNKLNDSRNSSYPIKHLPRFPSLPEYFNDYTPEGRPQKTPFQPMSIFHISSLEDYPQHTYQERFNLIASGNKNDPTCRWGDFPEERGNKKENDPSKSWSTPKH